MGSNEKQIRALILGGAHAQIPLIKESRARGYYIITCDYLPGNPGHTLADEYHNISTTDKLGVLNLAKQVKPDFIIAYASDPAAPVAAYVSEELGLPGNSYESVRHLSEKDMFRSLQREKGLNVPDFVTLTETDNPLEKLKLLKYPYIIKPTDSSGSKGVTKISSHIEIEPAINYAMGFSRSKRIIAEEFIDNEQADIHGDGFVVNGELIFTCLGDHIYNKKSNPFNPIGTLWPSKHPGATIRKIEKDVASLIKFSGFISGPVNIEARINSEGKHYIMEIGPRSGGNFVPQAIKYATGFDMVKASLDVMAGHEILMPDREIKCSAYYALHTDFDGELTHLSLSKRLIPYINEFHQYLFPGDEVKPFTGANAAIGILLMTFSNREEMDYILTNMCELINLRINRN